MSFEKPVCVADIEAIARRNLTKNALNYYVSGADGEQTLSENCKAFDRYVKECFVQTVPCTA